MSHRLPRPAAPWFALETTAKRGCAHAPARRQTVSDGAPNEYFLGFVPIANMSQMCSHKHRVLCINLLLLVTAESGQNNGRTGNRVRPLSKNTLIWTIPLVTQPLLHQLVLQHIQLHSIGCISNFGTAVKLKDAQLRGEF